MVNLPSRWNAGCAALRAAKLVDLADPSILYTNEYVDQALKS
jgi:hypothetical protein